MRHQNKQGFTLVELSLSILFVGIMSIALALIIANTLASYRRGLTLNRVNEIGQALVDDFKTAVQNSSSESVLSLCTRFYNDTTIEAVAQAQANCKSDGGRSFTHLERIADVTLNNSDAEIRRTLEKIPVYGVFCAGTYSYIWVSGYFDTEDVAFPSGVKRPTFTYKKEEASEPTTISNFRLLKIADSDRAVCLSLARPYSLTGGEGSYSTNYEEAKTFAGENFGDFNIVNGYNTISGEPTELLNLASANAKGVCDRADWTNDQKAECENRKAETTDLVIYSFDMASPAESLTERNAFYSASFVLGTKDGGVDIKANGKACAAPATYMIEQFDYCAINKFSFAAQTNGNQT